MQDQNVNIKNQSSSEKLKPELKYRAFYLSLNTIKLLDNMINKQSTRILSNQLIRSVTSIGANIVEAKSSSSKREFVNYFQIALKSANETKYWLALLKELCSDHKELIDDLIQETNEISKILGSSILTMKGKNRF